MNRLFKTDGTVIDITPANEAEGFTLEECQEMVGGYIETLNCNLAGHLAICDEEGLMKNKIPNRQISTIVGYTLVGDVMIIERKNFK
jgi:hypothetical protein